MRKPWLELCLALLLIAGISPLPGVAQSGDVTGEGSFQAPSFRPKDADKPSSPSFDLGSIGRTGKPWSGFDVAGKAKAANPFAASSLPKPAPGSRLEAGASPGRRAGLPRLGIAFKLSTLGIGGDVATALTRRSNLRFGFNYFGYDRGFNKDGIQYAASLLLESAEAHLDYFPLWGFHLSPGVMLYNGNQISAGANVPGGQQFKLGGTAYMSDPSDPISGNAKLDFVKIAPTFLIGLGNLLPRHGHRISVNLEAGVAYQNSPRTTLSLKGSVCDTSGLNCRSVGSDPTVQSNIQAEQQKVNNDISWFKLYPLISLSIGYKIR